MTPESAKALDEQVRACTKAVLREGTDYGVIPGTNGEKSLWRPGAQKLLQWFGLECTCERVDIERDDDGRKHGITYRADVGRGLKTATPVILATCEGTADYDESKFYQTAEQVQRKAKDAERKWAREDRRAANADQVEERQRVPGGLERAHETRPETGHRRRRGRRHRRRGHLHRPGRRRPRPGTAGRRPQLDARPRSRRSTTSPKSTASCRQLYTAAAEAHKKGLCNRKQQDLVQNTARQARQEAAEAAVVVEVEDLADKAAAEASQDAAEESQEPAEDTPPGLDPPDSWPEATKPGTGTPKGK